MEPSPPNRLGYRNLNVWKDAMAFAEAINTLLNARTWERNRALRAQLQRSSVSVPSNIAEGEEQSSNKHSLNFYHVARGSLAEARTQLILAKAQGIISSEVFKNLDLQAETVARLIGGVIRMRRKREEQNRY